MVLESHTAQRVAVALAETSPPIPLAEAFASVHKRLEEKWSADGV